MKLLLSLRQNTLLRFWYHGDVFSCDGLHGKGVPCMPGQSPTIWTMAQAMISIGELAPGFLEANTDAAFMLLTARFYVMAADGKVQEAVPFARSHLAPLVRDNAARTDQMKVRFLNFLDGLQ